MAAVTEAVTKHWAPLPYAGACFNPSTCRVNSQVSPKFVPLSSSRQKLGKELHSECTRFCCTTCSLKLNQESHGNFSLRRSAHTRGICKHNPSTHNWKLFLAIWCWGYIVPVWGAWAAKRSCFCGCQCPNCKSCCHHLLGLRSKGYILFQKHCQECRTCGIGGLLVMGGDWLSQQKFPAYETKLALLLLAMMVQQNVKWGCLPSHLSKKNLAV